MLGRAPAEVSTSPERLKPAPPPADGPRVPLFVRLVAGLLSLVTALVPTLPVVDRALRTTFSSTLASALSVGGLQADVITPAATGDAAPQATVRARATVTTSRSLTVQALGICARDTSGRISDFPALARTTLRPGEPVSLDADRTVGAGRYSYVVCAKRAGVWFHVGEPRTLDVAEAVTPPSGLAVPTRGPAGWTLSWTDDFTGGELDRTRWFPYRGQPGGDPGGWWEPSHVRVEGSLLRLEGYQEDGRWVTGGISETRHTSVTRAQTYGKYEVRMRIDRGTGIAFAALLWPVDNSWPPEIDFAEDNGDDRATNHATLHWGQPHTQSSRTVSVDLTQWHTWGVEWSPGRLVYTLDGAPWAVEENVHVPDVPMSLAVQTQAWHCEANWQRCPDATTPDRVDLEVDWVAVYRAS